MDADLLEGFRRGDRDGLARVYHLYARGVENRVRQALVRMGRLTRADLADVVQDVFVQAFSDTARAQYDGVREYGPFLLTIASNVVIDWVRRRNREALPLDLLAEFSRTPEAADVDDLAGPYDVSLVTLTDAYIAMLPAELRRVHQCRFGLSLPQRQAAAALGITRQSLRTLEKKLVVGLRRYLRSADARGLAGGSDGLAVASEAAVLSERMVVDAPRR
jgi:RNA polymerase sigma factor (sigma-70 family)